MYSRTQRHELQVNRTSQPLGGGIIVTQLKNREREGERKVREGMRTNRDSEGEIDEFVPMREVMIHHCMVELVESL